MTSEERDCFKTNLKDIAFSSFKLFGDNCKLENNFSAKQIDSLKALIRDKNLIQKANKINTAVITDKEKYAEGVKSAILDADKFVHLNIAPGKYCTYILNVEKKLNTFSKIFR